MDFFIFSQFGMGHFAIILSTGLLSLIILSTAEAISLILFSVSNYITIVEREGMKGVISERSGLKGHWKLTPEMCVQLTVFLNNFV